MIKKFIRIFVILLILSPIIFIGVGYFKDSFLKHRYVKKCYKENKQTFEIVTDFFKEQSKEAAPTVMYDQESHMLETWLGKNSEFLDCSNEEFDKKFSELRDKYQKEFEYNVFSFIRADYDDSGNMLLYFAVYSEKINKDKVRNYYLVYIDEEYQGGSDLCIGVSSITDEPVSENWYYWSRDVLLG